jgi:hypothetical protein
MATPPPHRSSNLSTDAETALYRMHALFSAICEVATAWPSTDKRERISTLASMGEAIAEDQIADLQTDTEEEEGGA